MANHDDPRKQFGLRLEESVIEQIGRQAQAQHVSPAEYGRRLIRSALQVEQCSFGGDLLRVGLAHPLSPCFLVIPIRGRVDPGHCAKSIVEEEEEEGGVETGAGSDPMLAIHACFGYIQKSMPRSFECLSLAVNRATNFKNGES